MKREIYRNLANIYSSLLNIDKNKKQQNTILLFHSVSEENNSDIYDINIKKFQNIIEFLNNNYEFGKFNDLLKLNNKIIITFDDGYLNNLKLAIPVLQKFEVPSHIFVTTDFIESRKKEYLNQNDLKELSKIQNVSIGSHGKSHTKLENLDDNKIESELIESKKFIEDIISKEVNSVSYPHGSFNERVIKIIKNSEYKFGATSVFGSISTNVNKFILPRIDIWSDDTNKIINQKINGYWNFINYINKLKNFKL